MTFLPLLKQGETRERLVEVGTGQTLEGGNQEQENAWDDAFHPECEEDFFKSLLYLVLSEDESIGTLQQQK